MASSETSDMKIKAAKKSNAPGHAWVAQWLSAVADGRRSMSQRKLSSIEKHTGSIELVKAVARDLKVHLVQLVNDKGNLLVAASKHECKVIA